MSSPLSDYPEGLDDEVDGEDAQKSGLEEFLYDGPLDTALGFAVDHTITRAERTALELRRTSLRFAIKIDIENEKTCCTVDRAAVIAVYQDALQTLDLPQNKQYHLRILSEATHRARIILGIISAHPLDAAFFTADQLLAPLEPQYAEPRISSGNDQRGYRAQWQFLQWRNNGWPDRYPARAVKTELEGDFRLAGKTKGLALKLRKRWQDMDMGSEDEVEIEDETAVQLDVIGGERVDNDEILNDIWD